jgi:SAM-dependent methyltransferase
MVPPCAKRFVQDQLKLEDVCGRSVLELGSRDPYAEVRNIVMPLQPAQYTGVDLIPGPGVDVVCPAERLLDRFAPESFDLVVSTEVLEHVRDWRRVVHNLKSLLREDAILISTTRSRGYEFHGYPLDFWRFEPEDISEIFGDLEVETIERDTDDPPGVFFRARRPSGFTERNLDVYPLYSVVRRRHARSLTPFDVAGARGLATGQAVLTRLLPLSARKAIRQAVNQCSGRARQLGAAIHVDGPDARVLPDADAEAPYHGLPARVPPGPKYCFQRLRASGTS